MKTIEITQTAGADRLLHLTIPVDEAGRPYRVVIVLAPESETQGKPTCDDKGWPMGYFENTFGSIQDESFFRHPQPDHQERPGFE